MLDRSRRKKKLGLLFLAPLFAAFALDGCGSSNITTWSDNRGARDTVSPHSQSVTINGGAASTSSSSVSLSLQAVDDTAVAAYYVSVSPEAPSADSSGWTAVSPVTDYRDTVSYDMGSETGQKTLYVWFKDSSGNVSAPSSATIELKFVAADVASPNVVLIIVDTLRFDHLSTAGYSRNTAPNIASVAESSVVFANAIAPSSWSLPCFTSILQGEFAYHHDQNLTPTESPSGTFLVNYLKDAGYRTVSIQTNYLTKYLEADFDDRYFYIDSSTGDLDKDHMAANTAIKWLVDNKGSSESFFMFMGLFSPHWTYRTDNGYLSEFVMDSTYKSMSSVALTFVSGIFDGILYSDLSTDVQSAVNSYTDANGNYLDSRLYVSAYDSEIKYSDAQLGRVLSLLKEQGRYDDSLIIITADHGENMVDHTVYFSHGNNLYNSLIHVPLIIKFPRQQKQKVVTDYVRTIDILPTVFDYAGIDTGHIDGRTLMPVVNGEAVDNDERAVISYMQGAQTKTYVSIIKDGYKLIKTDNGDELYDLSSNPNETINLAFSYPERLSTLNSYLRKYYQY